MFTIPPVHNITKFIINSYLRGKMQVRKLTDDGSIMHIGVGLLARENFPKHDPEREDVDLHKEI